MHLFLTCTNTQRRLGQQLLKTTTVFLLLLLLLFFIHLAVSCEHDEFKDGHQGSQEPNVLLPVSAFNEI